MHLTSAFVSSSLFSLVYAATIGPVTSLHIANQVISPDGFKRSTVLAGKRPATASVPGPIIAGTKNGSFSINVINELKDTTMLTTTSVHWHGLFQSGTNWADGPVGVTQCPIIPGNSFLYQFSVPDQAGTFWYHSHHSTQYCDGLRGPLVIYDPEDPHRSLYDLDKETTVITLADWYHTPAPSAGLIPTPDATLINGLGRYADGPSSPLAIINVQPNKRYRMRLISISCDPNYTFSIDDHTMTVIEADGISTNPVTVNAIQIFVGQRYSFVLTTNQPVNNYWIRANPNVGMTGFANGLNSAILRYAGAPLADPTTNQGTTTNLLAETSLSPLLNPGAPGAPTQGGADINFNFDIEFNITDSRYLVNGATFIPPTTPVLLQILSGAKTAQNLLSPGSVYVLPRNKIVEVSIPGGSAGSPHPIHLHGQTFDVVRSAGSSTYNYKNPVRRDVVSIGSAGDNVTFRFNTNNPGPWIMYCHNNWHLNLGLAIVFVTDVDTVSRLDPPEGWNQLCPAYNGSGLP
ncbi:multicopper oxidase [Amanita muscaria Koide BX008]|uniref:Multicopper oxidase n=1 Tax=Amanita muscaria (strain Koide BX008) TaxID=946122 RepID=A0A0C2T8A5_AMAMK|nr:multicopper oxidase [Amanita muscaria Koide BX008]